MDQENFYDSDDLDIFCGDPSQFLQLSVPAPYDGISIVDESCDGSECDVDVEFGGTEGYFDLTKTDSGYLITEASVAD